MVRIDPDGVVISEIELVNESRRTFTRVIGRAVGRPEILREAKNDQVKLFMTREHAREYVATHVRGQIDALNTQIQKAETELAELSRASARRRAALGLGRSRAGQTD